MNMVYKWTSNKFSKRFLLVLFSLFMFFCVACGKGSNNVNPSNVSSESIQQTQTSQKDENVKTEAAKNETTKAEITKKETTKAETTKKDTTKQSETNKTTTSNNKINENGSYFSKDEVALYIHTYGKLPSNFITKEAAEKLGWSGGSLEKYAPGKAIGGSHYGNYEKTLPVKSGRKYTECDIDTNGKSSRGAKRIVFSNDGLIYYTDDHYEHFELLYGEE